MRKSEIIGSIAHEIERKFSDDCGGHDWWHTWRVWQLSKKIALIENGDIFIVELSALLHDVADWKYNDGNELIGGETVRAMLSKYPLQETVIDEVAQIVDSISFKGSGVVIPMKTLEGRIVQDADRLDALGAIGIARTFAYGGMKGRSIYDPTVKPQHHETFEMYKNSVSPTINHFHEKLLLLKGLMNTDTGKEIANERHHFMEQYLLQFFDEWNYCNNK